MTTALRSPLGVPMAVEAHRADRLAAIADVFRGWEGAPDPGARILRLDVASSRSLSGTGGVGIEAAGPMLRIAGAGVDAGADAERGEAWCRVSEAYLDDEARLREAVLDPLILFLLTRNGRIPLHAAAFLAGDLAVLLAGPSGSGKSCLALAAADAGFALLSDDTVYVQLEPHLRIWGIPRPVHVFPGDAPRGSGGALRWRGGKLKRAVESAARASVATRAVLCILEPGEAVSLRPIDAHEAMRLLDRPEPGFDLLWPDVRAAQAALCREGAWRLRLSSDPSEAVRLLRDSLPNLRARA